MKQGVANARSLQSQRLQDRIDREHLAQPAASDETGLLSSRAAQASELATTPPTPPAGALAGGQAGQTEQEEEEEDDDPGRQLEAMQAINGKRSLCGNLEDLVAYL